VVRFEQPGVSGRDLGKPSVRIMRLTHHQVEVVRETVAAMFGSTATVHLFGSRVDDAALGGDIDLLVETDEMLENRAAAASRLAAALQLRLGDQRIDVVLVDAATPLLPVHRAARREGIRL
jgi:predicted nucleotidyltransferase